MVSCPVYLRVVIGGMNALMVACVAAVTLSVSLTISFRVLDDNVKSALSQLGLETATTVNDFFARPQRQMASLVDAPQMFPLYDDHVLPTERQVDFDSRRVVRVQGHMDNGKCISKTTPLDATPPAGDGDDCFFHTLHESAVNCAPNTTFNGSSRKTTDVFIDPTNPAAGNYTTCFRSHDEFAATSAGIEQGASEHDSLTEYGRHMLVLLADSSFIYQRFETGFIDGSSLLMLPVKFSDGAKRVVSLMNFPTSSTQRSTSAITVHDTYTGRYAGDNATAQARAALGSLSSTDLRNPAFFNGIRNIFNASSLSSFSPTKSVGWAPTVFIRYQNEDLLMMSLLGQFQHKDGSPAGYGHLTLPTQKLRGILQQGQLTAHTRLFLYDEKGYLMGSNSERPVYTVSNWSGTPAADDVPGHCHLSLTATKWIVTDYPHPLLACRYHITGSYDDELAQFAKKEIDDFQKPFQEVGDHVPPPGGPGTMPPGGLPPPPGPHAVPRFKNHLKRDDGMYLFLHRLEAMPGQHSLALAMVVPEKGMIGDAAIILPLCASISAGLVLIVAAAGLAFVWYVLAPLQTIVLHMDKAARLEKDDTTVSVSVFSEISELQRAFVDLRDELSRIRAFVPQSLLERRSSDEDEAGAALEYGPGENGEGEDENCPDTGRSSGLAVSEIDMKPLSSNSAGHFSLEAGPPPPPQSSASTSPSSMTLDSASGPTAGSSTRRYGSQNDVGGVSPSSSKDLGQRKPFAARAAAMASRHPHLFPAAARKRLKVDAGIKVNNVTVLCLNMRGFHKATSMGINSTFVATIVQAVSTIAQQEKGVVDSFHGDRFMISFNAVRPAANHGMRAGLVALRVAERLRSLSESGESFKGTGLTAGVATGPAQIGNLGSNDMKKFCIVGPVVTQATCLERLCKLYVGARCLVPQRLFQDLRTAAQLRTVDFVKLPFAGKPCLVADVVAEFTTDELGDDEWMYQMQYQESSANAQNNRRRSTTAALVRGESGSVAARSTRKSADQNSSPSRSVLGERHASVGQLTEAEIAVSEECNQAWDALVHGDLSLASALVNDVEEVEELLDETEQRALTPAASPSPARGPTSLNPGATSTASHSLPIEIRPASPAVDRGQVGGDLCLANGRTVHGVFHHHNSPSPNTRSVASGVFATHTNSPRSDVHSHGHGQPLQSRRTSLSLPVFAPALSHDGVSSDPQASSPPRDGPHTHLLCESNDPHIISDAPVGVVTILEHTMPSRRAVSSNSTGAGPPPPMPNPAHAGAAAGGSAAVSVNGTSIRKEATTPFGVSSSLSGLHPSQFHAPTGRHVGLHVTTEAMAKRLRLIISLGQAPPPPRDLGLFYDVAFCNSEDA